MRTARYGGLVAGLFISLSSFVASANTTNISFDPIYAEGPFTFWCQPYIHSFENNKYYKPASGGCTFSVPNTITGREVVALYRGEIGSSTIITSDLVSHAPTLVQTGVINFVDIAEGELMYAVIYDSNLNQDNALFHNYLQSGGTLPLGAIEGQSYHTLSWKYGPKPVEEFEPVVVIPGILGSWEKNGEWVLDPISHTYDNLVDTLLANGYVENETLFKFPYDWHKSNVETALLLKDKIADIKSVCDCDRVDLVTHSMGGLVASQYIAGDEYQDDVDQVFFIGTPFAGAPKAYKTWEGGEVDFGNDLTNIVMHRVFEREARDSGFDSIFDYLHSGLIPSVEQLLPAYFDYLIPSGTSSYLPYPDGYPRNIFLEELLVDVGANMYKRVLPFVIAGNFEASLSTPTRFVVQPSTQLPKWEHGEIVSTELDIGDGTVPWLSATFFAGFDKELPSEHNELASTSAPYVFEKLVNREAESVVGKDYEIFFDADLPVLIAKLAPSAGDFRILLETLNKLLPYNETPVHNILLVLLFSPIDLEITAPDGKRVGKDITTGTVLDEIENTFYSGSQTEHEFVIILDPKPGEYRVKTVGTGDGSYTIAAGYGDSATTSESFVYGTTTVNQIIENTLTVSATSTTVEIVEDTPPPQPTPVEEVTPQTCVEDMQLAYENGWIKKKSVYNALVADCKRLGVLLITRDKAKNNFIRRGVALAITLTLNHMDKLAKDKSVTAEGTELIVKNTIWFRNDI